MAFTAPIKDHHSERQLFVSRVILSAVIGLMLLGIVVGRLVQLQILQYEQFAEQSQGNRIRIKAVVGPAFVVGLSLIVFIILIVSIFIGI